MEDGKWKENKGNEIEYFNSWPCIVAMPTHTWDFYGLLVIKVL
jgi:hypothetical protein